MHSRTTRCSAPRRLAPRGTLGPGSGSGSGLGLGIAFVLPAIAAFALASACKKSEQSVPTSELEIADAPRLVTGPVGAGVEERQATYVLVDVKNNGNDDVIVSLAGELLDTAETSLGPLRVETLRIPPNDKRLFALVDAEVVNLPNAVAARVEVSRARRPPQPAPAVVTGVRVHTDQGRAVIEGTVENRTNKSTAIVVLGAFYDRGGAPLMRRTTVYRIDGGQKRSAQFVGPEGSVTGALFIGDTGL